METAFLVVSLFLPRTTLIVTYLFFVMPYNTVPFIVDLLLAICLPRVLILIYIVQNLGTNTPWFWIHLVVALFVYFGGGKKIRDKWKGN